LLLQKSNPINGLYNNDPKTCFYTMDPTSFWNMDLGGTFSVRKIYLNGCIFSHGFNGTSVHVGMDADIGLNPTVRYIVTTAPEYEEMEIILQPPVVGRYLGFSTQTQMLMFGKIEVYE